MNKKIKITIIIVLIIFLSIGSSIAFLHDTKKEEKENLLLIRCQDDSCKQDDVTTTKTTTKVTETTTQEAIASNLNPSSNDNQQSSDSSSSSAVPADDNNNTSESVIPDPVDENNNIESEETNVVNNSPKKQSTNRRRSDDEVVMYGDDTISVKDDIQIWEKNTTFDMLSPGEYLVPGKHGTYDFSVYNIVDEDVVYMITFHEENKYNANILYKLKRNNEYIAGNEDEWVHYNEMNFKNRILSTGETDEYNLEWRWVDAPNDTEVGRADHATYSFGIHVMAYKEIDYDPNYSGEGDSDEEEAIESDITLINPKTGSEEESKTVEKVNPKTGDEVYMYLLLVFLSLIGLLIIKHYRGNKNESI